MKACPAVLGQVMPTRSGGCHTVVDATQEPAQPGSAGDPGVSPILGHGHVHPATPSDVLPEAEPAQLWKITWNCCTAAQALWLNPPTHAAGPAAARKTVRGPAGPDNWGWSVTHRHRHSLLSVPPAKEYCPRIPLSPGSREESCPPLIQLADTLCLFQSRSSLQSQICFPHPCCILHPPQKNLNVETD